MVSLCFYIYTLNHTTEVRNYIAAVAGRGHRRVVGVLEGTCVLMKVTHAFGHVQIY